MKQLLLLAVLGLSDPRIELVELQAKDQLEEALRLTERRLEENPREAAAQGLSYLRGHLLEKLGDDDGAAEAFATVVATSPALAEYARFRVAQAQERLGHPEVAAGLVATLLGHRPPAALVEPAVDLLESTLARGGDCRLLRGLEDSGLPSKASRRLGLSHARCRLRSGDPQGGRELLTRLLREQRTDLTGLLAAEQLFQLQLDQQQLELAQLLGEAFHHHRRFDRAEPFLLQATSERPTIRTQDDFELHYRLVRGRFWRGSFEVAADGYGSLAAKARTPRHVAQALYHRGRALELAGHWPPAIVAFRQSYNAEPTGNFAGAALLSALRLEWRLGSESTALELYGQLQRMSTARLEAARAALFLASSDAVRGRTERIEGWLDDATGASRRAVVEAHYWRGRLRENAGQYEAAVDAYLRALQHDYYHPMAQEARRRLDVLPHPELRLARAQEEDAAGNAYAAWILYGPGTPRGEAQRRELRGELQRTYRRGLVPSRAVNPSAWPLWQQRLESPEELLLALGLWHEGAPAVRRHFPMSYPELAFTASLELQRAQRVRESLLITEVLARAVPSRVPAPAVEDAFRRTNYPFAYRFLIERSAHRYGVDPKLLVALIREESRFDPRAASGAAARGLTQFVLPTAARLSQKIGLPPVGPLELQEPATAIELGAAYLAELKERSGALVPAMVASYNAGEAQADLWQLHCFTEDPAEFLTKVGFTETRNYVARVLSGHAIYQELYPPPRDRTDVGP